MCKFTIVSDSSIDMPASMIQELGLQVLPLSFTIGDKTYLDLPDERDMPIREFYNILRNGGSATTAALNVGQYTDALEPLLSAGQDVLLLVFSSGLSTTYNSARLAADDLREKYPDRKLLVVDTLCASLGQGLLTWYAANLKREGKSIEEVRDWVEANKLHLCHWFTVNDLYFLKRGGRVSAATAMVGTMLQIKPVLHVDNEGHLINVAKARGRNASLMALVDHMEETAIDPGSQTIFISHGDCLEDAQKVGDEVKRRFGVKDIVYNNVGPVIGSHSGPGTVALFFLGKER